MGKPNDAPRETTVKHFSHQHPLKLSNYQPQQHISSPLCSACKLQVSGLIYGCSTCNFFLHKKCSEMPQKITHPFHKEHVLSLLTKPTYPDGLFNCDACGEAGNGFSYHCKGCSIDLHILCAAMPLSLNHGSHPHRLNLTFSCPYPTKTFYCYICHNQGSNHWLYRCSSCSFDAHLKCAKSVQPLLQQPDLSSFKSQTPIPQAQAQHVGMSLRSIPQPQSQGPQYTATPNMQANNFTPQMQPQNIPYGVPAGPSLPGSGISNEILLQMIQQMYANSLQANQNAMQAISMMTNSGGGFGGNRGSQQLLQLLARGGGGGIPGFDLFGGGGSGGIPGFDLFGGGGVGGGLDALQSLLGGSGLDLLGGGGLDFLGGLGGMLGGFGFC